MVQWRPYGAVLALWLGALGGLAAWGPERVLADPQVHRVRQGDTLTRIARRYRVGIRDLQTANGLGRRSHLAVGQELVIPGDEPVDGTTLATLRERRERGRITALAERLGIGTTRGAQNLLVDPPPRRWVRAAPRGRLNGTLLFPVPRGWWGRGWGSGRGGYHLAVDMPGPSGSPVRAAERGIVVYAGEGVRGYGKFVMIVHSNGWVTAYAHNSRFRVAAGQKVRRGERIADLGSTGISRGPHVHFMLLHRGEHCDPTPLFRPAARRRGGQRLRVASTRWRDSSPPASVRCLPRSARPFPRGGEDAVDRGEDIESGEGDGSGSVGATSSRSGRRQGAERPASGSDGDASPTTERASSEGEGSGASGGGGEAPGGGASASRGGESAQGGGGGTGAATPSAATPTAP